MSDVFSFFAKIISVGVIIFFVRNFDKVVKKWNDIREKRMKRKLGAPERYKREIDELIKSV